MFRASGSKKFEASDALGDETRALGDETPKAGAVRTTKAPLASAHRTRSAQLHRCTVHGRRPRVPMLTATVFFRRKQTNGVSVCFSRCNCARASGPV